MKNSELVERLCSLLDLEREASAEDVFEAVKSLRDDRSDANDTAGDLTHALVAIEEVLGVPPNNETRPDPCLAAIDVLKEERRGWELDYRQVTDALELDADEGQESVLEALQELRASQARGEENGRKFREAAGLDPHAPVARVLADIEAMNDERVALRRMLALQADAASDVVFDAVDKLKRLASNAELGESERRIMRQEFGRIATELGLPPAGTTQAIVDAIRKLKPAPREAALSNAAWLASAWETITQHLRIQPGASVQDALAVIDEAIDVRDRVITQFDFSEVTEFDQLGAAVEHRILAARAAQAELSRRLTLQEQQLGELRDLHARYCVAAKIDPAYPPLSVQECLVTLCERREELSGFVTSLCVALGLPPRSPLDEVFDAVKELQAEADLLADHDLLVERASAVSELVGALTSANARLAVSIAEASR